MSGSLSETSRTVFQLGYEISPIILTGDSQITRLIGGGMLPIIALTESINFVRGLLSAPENIKLDEFFAHFSPLPGSSLIDNQVGLYPFANQSVAANALITNPHTISMRMMCPVRGEGGYLTKLATLTALQTTLELHNNSGGTYIVATPGFIYTQCLMTKLMDASSGSSKQVQDEYQFDFIQPLLTLSAAAGAQGNFIQRATAGLVTDGSLSGASITPGQMLSGAFSALSPSAQGLAGAALQLPTQLAPLLPVTSVPL